MLAGDFEQAWQQSDELRRRDAPDPHRFWSGEPIAGKRLIVRALHGFGDAVQMLRYAPLLRAQAASVVYELPPRLLPLAHCFQSVDRAISWEQTSPAWDLQLEVMELPYLFRTTLADLPIARNYLKVKPFPLPTRSKPRIGIVWSAGAWNPARSIPLRLLETLLRSTRFEFQNLQGRENAHEAAHLPLLPGPADGILPLAQTVAALDLIVSVDTLAAHLAGALGVPCLLLLQHAADWRWLRGRSDSPWYPSLKLFRQRALGDWQSVLEPLQHHLAKLNP
jgi:hypothetical protein